MMSYVAVAVGVLAIELCGVGFIAGAFYLYDRLTSR